MERSWMDYDVYVGMDVGKCEDYVVALVADGDEKLIDSPVPKSECDLLQRLRPQLEALFAGDRLHVRIALELLACYGGPDGFRRAGQGHGQVGAHPRHAAAHGHPGRRRVNRRRHRVADRRRVAVPPGRRAGVLRRPRAAQAPVEQEPEQGLSAQERKQGTQERHHPVHADSADLGRPEKEQYWKKRAEGKEHKQAIRAPVRRRVEVIYAMLSTGSFYQPPTAMA